MKIPHWKLFSWSNFFLKILAFYCLCGEFFVTPFSTLAMIHGSLPTNSTTPDRLRCRARPPDDVSTVFLTRRKSIKKVFFRARHLVLVVIYTPKEAHSRNFVTGGSVIAWQVLAKFFLWSCSWRGELVLPAVFLWIPEFELVNHKKHERVSE